MSAILEHLKIVIMSLPQYEILELRIGLRNETCVLNVKQFL